MRKSALKSIRVLFAAIMVFFFSVELRSESSKPVKPALLFIIGANASDGPHPPARELVKRLGEKNFVVDCLKWKEVSPSTFANYDVVVFFTFGKMFPGEQPKGIVKSRMKWISDYLNSGGSVLVNPYLAESPHDLVATSMFLEKLGASVSIMEIKDPSKAQQVANWHLTYAWTHNINRTFLGLKATDKYLWYPIGKYKYGVRTYALKLDAQWTPLVKTAETAFAAPKVIGVPYFDDKQDKKAVAGPLPIIAGRKINKGKIIVCGIRHPFTFSDPYAPGLSRVFIEKGLNNRPSCGLDLIIGMFKWLTQDAGNVARKRPVATNSNLLKPFRADRARIKTPLNLKRLKYRSFTYQKGAVFQLPDTADLADYISAVKKTSLKFAIFAKRTNAFKGDIAKFTAFKNECLGATDSNIVVIPAIVLKDMYGGTILATGKNIQYPGEVIFDEKKQELVIPKKKIPGSNDELGDAWMHYVFGQINSMSSVLASMNHSAARYPAGDFRDYNAIVVVTTKNGKVVENMLPDFLNLQDRGENLLPLALHKISSVAEIAKTVKNGYWLINMANENPLAYFSRRHMLDDPLLYITSGPEITSFIHKGARDFSNPGNPYDYSRWHATVNVDVSSDSGLKEIIIYDGPDIFKKFNIGGKKRFQIEIPIVHSKQHNLTMVARDVNGGEAISSEWFDRSVIAQEFMCSDRNNQFFYSAQRRNKGDEPYFTRSLGYGMAPNKGPWRGESAIYSAYKDDPLHRLAVKGFDGGPGNCVATFTLPQKAIKGELPLRSDPARVFYSSDIAVGMSRLNTAYPEGSKTSNVWHTLLPVVPTKYIDATVVQSYFIPRPYDDMPVLTHDVRLKFKKEYTPSKKEKLLFTMLRCDMREKMSWLVKSSTGIVFSGTFKEAGKDASANFALPFDKGSYIRMGEGSSGSYTVVSMTNGLIISERRNSNRMLIGFPNEGKPIPAGKEFTARFMFIGEPFNGPANNIPVEKAVNAYFKPNDPNLKIVCEKGEIVKRINYPIIANVDDGKVWKAEVSADISVATAFEITGLNPNASCYLYFPKRNKWRPVGMDKAGVAYLSLPGKSKGSVVVCNPLLPDNKKLKATLFEVDNGNWKVFVENGSDKKIDAVLKINPVFKPLAKFADLNVLVQPHTGVTEKLQTLKK